MHARPKSIALYGLFGVGNFGNDASFFAMLRHLRKAFPDAALSSICGDPARVTQQFGIPAVSMDPPYGSRRRRPRRALVRLLRKAFIRLPVRLVAEIVLWLRTVTYLRNVDVIIIPGTGILNDVGWPSSSFAYALFRWCVSAKLSGAKVRFVSIGAGPFKKRLNRWLMTAAARVADHRSYRDNASKEFMAGIGFDAQNDPVYPDLVFSLPTAAPAGHAKAEGEPLTVGVSIMAYRNWNHKEGVVDEVYRAYIEKLTTFVNWLLDQKYNVRLLIGESSDRRAVGDLLRGVPAGMAAAAGVRLVSEPINSMNDVLRQLAATDIVVGTRFHNVVGALMLNKPVVSVGYADNFDDLMREVGLAKYCQRVERLNVERLTEQFRELVRDRRRVEQMLREKNRQYREDLSRQFSDLCAWIASADAACRRAKTTPLKWSSDRFDAPSEIA